MLSPFTFYDIDLNRLSTDPAGIASELTEYCEFAGVGLETVKSSLYEEKLHIILLCKFNPILLSTLALDYGEQGLNKIASIYMSLAYKQPRYRQFVSWLRYFVFRYSYEYTGILKLVLDWKENGLYPYFRPPHDEKEWEDFLNRNVAASLRKAWIPGWADDDSVAAFYDSFTANCTIRAETFTKPSQQEPEPPKVEATLLGMQPLPEPPSKLTGIFTGVERKPKKTSKPKPKPAASSSDLFSF